MDVFLGVDKQQFLLWTDNFRIEIYVNREF